MSSLRIVWLVSNDQSQDIPEGVLAVYAKKSDAVSLAVEWMQAADAWPRHTRHELRHPSGVAVYWLADIDGSPYEMSVVPFEVKT